MRDGAYTLGGQQWREQVRLQAATDRLVIQSGTPLEASAGHEDRNAVKSVEAPWRRQ
jgi:hypothetical protein